MADYRLYSLEGDGHIGFAEWFQADSDEEAIETARQMRPGAQRFEVWNNHTLVASIHSEVTAN
jgi:hypothetical protein